MTKEFSNYMTRFCNLNLEIKSIRQKDKQTKTETVRQTKTKSPRQTKTDRHTKTDRQTNTDRQTDKD